MKSKPLLVILLAICLAACLGCQRDDTTELLEYPSRPIKVIVPFAAGGGTDTFARTIQQAIEDAKLLPVPLVIINVPGASGTIGSRRVLDARPDGYTLLCLHEAILTARYSGKVPYGPEAFEPIAGTGTTSLVICVGKDSPIQNLGELMEAAAKQPDEVAFAANIGAPSHFAGLMLEHQKEGARFRYTQIGGGAKRFAALLGGHAAVSAFSLAEYAQFEPAGLRGLAICAPQRHEAVPEIPTATEEGFPCISQNTQFWWAPRGTDTERTNRIADAIAKAMQSADVKERLAATYTDATFLSGDQLLQDISERNERLTQVDQRPMVELPNFVAFTSTATLLLLTLVLVQSWRRRDQNAPDRTPHSSWQARTLALTISIIVASYVVALQTASVDFRIATAAFLILSGLLLLWFQHRSTVSRRIATWIAFACVFSVGLHALFTRVLVLDLP